MTQYIDKSVVVAEIKKHQAIWDGMDSDYCKGQRLAYSDVLSYLDTLEVIEVDLEKEFDNYIEKQNAFTNNNREIKYYNGDSFNHVYDIYPIAKHFFELGISIKHSITSADKGVAQKIIFFLERIERGYNICLTKEKEWVNKQVQKGE